MKTSKATPYIFLLPYLLLFVTFIVVPIAIAIGLSFTDFNTIQSPNFVGFMNYINLFTQDSIFMQYVLPNTVTFVLIVGPGGYALAFLLAWAISQLTKAPRTVLALIFYSPSLTQGVAMQVMWRQIFLGESYGYLNAVLIDLGILNEPRLWLTDGTTLLLIMIIVGLWSSMGVGFLAMLAGIMNADDELYEAGAIDGIKNRFQEMIYITIPTMKPQMLFGAVMAIVNTFNNGALGVQLSGTNPTPLYAGQLIVNHIEDYAYLRYDMGIAASLSVLLLILIYFLSKVVFKLLAEND